jgi:hypothetical protein
LPISLDGVTRNSDDPATKVAAITRDGTIDDNQRRTGFVEAAYKKWLSQLGWFGGLSSERGPFAGGQKGNPADGIDAATAGISSRTNGTSYGDRR